MVEQEQPTPTLKPKWAPQVDRQHHQNKLNREHKYAQQLNQRAQQLYKKPLRELHKNAAEKNRLSLEFNTKSEVEVEVSPNSNVIRVQDWNHDF